MNDKKNISIYLPVSFLLEIDNFIKNNNITSRGDFVCAAARYYMDNFNKVSIKNNQDSNIKSMEESPALSIDENQPSFTQSSIDDLYRLLDQSIIDDKSTKNNLSNLVEQVIEQLKEFNNKSSKILATLIDDKSSKTSETIIDDNRPTLTKEDDSWEDPKSKSEEAPQTNQIEQMARQARKTELRNQIKPMSHYTHLETYKDENSVIYQEVYKQYKLRYNSIPRKNPQYTFDLLNYMAPVLKTEKIYREFLERIEKAEFSKDKHNWQKDGSRYGYNLQKHLESLIDIQVQYSGTQKINLSNFIPYTIQEETSRKVMPWEKEGAI